MKRLFSVLVIVSVALCGVVLHLRNHQMVVFDYYFGTRELPLSWLIVLPLGTGFAFGVLVAAAIIVRLKHRLRGSEKRNGALAVELDRQRYAAKVDES